MAAGRNPGRDMQSPADGRQWYAGRFEAFEKSLNGDGSSGFRELRRAAIQRFSELGFPTTRDEEWRHTDLSDLARSRFSVDGKTPDAGPEVPDILPLIEPEFADSRIVLVNGGFSRKLSSVRGLPPGVTVGTLVSAMAADPETLRRHFARYARYDDDALTALNTAFMRDGVFISVADGVVLDHPIELLFLSVNGEVPIEAHPRCLILAGRNARVSVIERYTSFGDGGPSFTNAVTEIALGENSFVGHDRVQSESDEAYHIAALRVHQARDSVFVSNNISFGALLTRNTIGAVLDGEGAECTLNGLYLGTGHQLVDNHTTIDHARPHCPSHELYKGILAERSRGVFNGRIKVRRDAQKTDAKQTNKNLVLSDDASIDTKPELEIFANDVRCTHGATVGQLDPEAMFYLRSRGIGNRESRAMLIHAFAADVVERVSWEPLKERLRGMIGERLNVANGVKQ